MAWLFEREIGPGNWGAVFQSIDAFRGLIEAVYARHGLPCAGIENLTPGTNAVFRVGDTVVKIFAPVESGFYGNDFPIEVEAQRHANRVGVASPRLLARGEILDRYVFRYIVMAHVRGREAEQVRGAMSPEEKRDFARRMRRVTGRLNIAIAAKEIPRVTAQTCLDSPRWDEFPEGFRRDRRLRIEAFPFGADVYTHGDLTAENMIIGDDGDVYVIDFADSRMAPMIYEWPPLVFALFGCDPVMMAEYFGAYDDEAFYDRLTAAVLMHEFGAGFVRQICEGLGVDVASIADVACLRDLVVRCVRAGDVKVK